MTIDRLSGAFLVLVGLFVVWERRVLPLGTTSHPGPGYVPLLLAILLIVFGAILIARGKGARPSVRSTGPKRRMRLRFSAAVSL